MLKIMCNYFVFSSTENQPRVMFEICKYFNFYNIPSYNWFEILNYVNFTNFFYSRTSIVELDLG